MADMAAHSKRPTTSSFTLAFSSSGNQSRFSWIPSSQHAIQPKCLKKTTAACSFSDQRLVNVTSCPSDARSTGDSKALKLSDAATSHDTGPET